MKLGGFAGCDLRKVPKIDETNPIPFGPEALGTRVSYKRRSVSIYERY
jgi:hypothetical protein